ncbi:FK506-binding protein 2-like [Stylophora pistillata]|uniref:FK506-binding protein 2-like n=1 Tax=Stylophora pistillata TaxID=50429 RepID=UPI000C055127|nr:FK506-binding protein 2-like [Stylophora pistillata]
MENNLRLLFCSLFLYLLCEYAFGAKKKKDLETIVEYNPATCEYKAYDGDIVSVHYTGTLENGQMFDSSLAKGREPLEFQLGKAKGKVIKATCVLIFTTELMSIRRKSLFDPKLLLKIGFWLVLAGVILYYLYRKASKESGKPDTKSSKKDKK